MSKKPISFDGVGQVRIFKKEVRKGMAAIEEYVYNEIIRGTKTAHSDIIVKRDGADRLAPVVSSGAQIRNLAAIAYDALQSSYGYFTELEKELKECRPKYNFKNWVCEEMERRVNRHINFISGIIPADMQEAKDLIIERDEIFEKYKYGDLMNAAQRRQRDVRVAREVAETCWKRPTEDSVLCERFEVKQEDLDRIRKKTFYIREIRALMLTSREGEELEKWVNKNLGKAGLFAEQMGLRVDIAEELFRDLYAQMIIDKDNIV